MNEVVYFCDVRSEIVMICGVAIVALICFAGYELVWRRKHPRAYTEQASVNEKKSIRRRLSWYFAFLYAWIFVLMAYITVKSGADSWPVLVVSGVICLNGILFSLFLRK